LELSLYNTVEMRWTSSHCFLRHGFDIGLPPVITGFKPSPKTFVRLYIETAVKYAQTTQAKHSHLCGHKERRKAQFAPLTVSHTGINQWSVHSISQCTMHTRLISIYACVGDGWRVGVVSSLLKACPDLPSESRDGPYAFHSPLAFLRPF
jgi:hypothetical protein